MGPRTFVVVGGTSGLGLSTARLLADDHDHRVAVSGERVLCADGRW